VRLDLAMFEVPKLLLLYYGKLGISIECP